jgi:hypothetical protein
VQTIILRSSQALVAQPGVQKLRMVTLLPKLDG